MNHNIVRLSITICVLLLGASLAQAQKVYIYDGTLGDADPRTQGILLDVPLGTPVVGPNPAGFTPNAAGDYVTIAPPSGTSYNYHMPLIPDPLPTSLAPIVAGDNYALEFQVQANPTPDHFTKAEVTDFITGTTTGSFGFRERFLMETNLTAPDSLDPGGGPDRFRLILQGGTVDVFGDRFLHVGEVPEFTSIYDMNTVRLVRNGFAFNVFINGGLIYSGLGNQSGIGLTQWNDYDGGSGTLSNYNLKYVSVERIPEPTSAALALLSVSGALLVGRRQRRL